MLPIEALVQRAVDAERVPTVARLMSDDPITGAALLAALPPEVGAVLASHLAPSVAKEIARRIEALSEIDVACLLQRLETQLELAIAGSD